MSTSISEGMAWGLPVICCNIMGLDELVIKNKTGYIIPLNDKKEMANMINKLLINENISKNLKQGKKIVLKNFTLENMLKNIKVIKSFN